MSTEHDILTFRFEAAKSVKHYNADSLSVYDVEGRPVIVRTGQFSDGDLVTYLPVDTLVPTDEPAFAFLKPSHTVADRPCHRIRAARLRGVFSMGLLVPALTSEEGVCSAESLGLTVYEPDVSKVPGASLGNRSPAAVPEGLVNVVYDLESLRKIANVIPNGTKIRVTEKLHGTNLRWALTCPSDVEVPQGESPLMEIHVGSRNLWLKYEEGNAYWAAVLSMLKDVGFRLLRVGNRFFWTEGQKSPGLLFVGELLGVQKGYPYDGSLRMFDGYVEGQRMPIDLTEHKHTVPVVGEFVWDESTYANLQDLANGKSLIDGKTQRESVVVEFVDGVPSCHIPPFSRFKLVGSEYLIKG